MDVAAEAASDLDAVAVLADACGSRRTTALRLGRALSGRSRVARRAWLAAVLADVAEGTCSVLEHGYLTRVERPHGLPVGKRQSSHRHAGTTVFRDVDYGDLGLVVELDGRLFHESTRARDRDLDRDLAAVVADERLTLRLSFGQVYDRGCTTAAGLAVVLRRRGWSGEPTLCPECG